MTNINKFEDLDFYVLWHWCSFWIGKCREYPKLSFDSYSEHEALDGIKKLVKSKLPKLYLVK